MGDTKDDVVVCEIHFPRGTVGDLVRALLPHLTGDELRRVTSEAIRTFALPEPTDSDPLVAGLRTALALYDRGASNRLLLIEDVARAFSLPPPCTNGDPT